MKRPKHPNLSADVLINRYTNDTYTVLRDQKHPQGGLYLYLRNERTKKVSTFHRSNLTSCFHLPGEETK